MDYYLTDNHDGTYTLSEVGGGGGGGAVVLIIIGMILLDIALLICMPIMYFTIFGGESGLGYLTGIPFIIAYLVFLTFNVLIWSSYFAARQEIKSRKSVQEEVDLCDKMEIAADCLKQKGSSLSKFLVKLENLCKWTYYAVLLFCLVYINIPNALLKPDMAIFVLGGPCAYYYLLKLVVFCFFVKNNGLSKKHLLTPLIGFFASVVVALLFILLVYLVQLPFYVEGGYYFSFENLEPILIFIFWAIPLDIHMGIVRKRKLK